ncbi:PTS transporter subunit EIIC [Streptococcus cuniculi]|uniref:PTS trehalose transporter subunit IIBC n=1 Tax=Streptococcus cuniculi TaxID=1432788 RepID=A0A4Y9JBZ6_9STRE|nr:PTS transporter subunit EIIC [Streptococcus cuniculi]MBF0778096.1 PTS transporter subunit EIIC [Streptococcus cuniculi]TFU98101.1 PTS trehalose transporter subunit IIBC [Streptococcus cuniculi]
METKTTVQQLLASIGGVANVSGNAICMTRLRLQLKDRQAVQFEALKQIEGVLGVVDADTLQIVFGPGRVTTVGQEFAAATGIPLGSVTEEMTAEELATVNKQENKAKHDKPLQRFLQKIANIFVPILPGIIAAGMINGLTNIINVSTNNAFAMVWWYQCIRTMSWGLFTFLPIYVGMNAAKEFKGSPILGAIAGAMFVSVPSMPLLTMVNEQAIILPLVNKAYSPGVGGLLAALFAGIFFAHLEKVIRKYMPSFLDTFLTPLLTVILGGLLTVIVIQPLGNTLTAGIYNTLTFIYEQLGVVGGYLLSAGFLPLVSVGLHQALTPIHVLLNNPDGPTGGINYLLPILMTAGGGQVGAGLALYFKTKNKKLKQLTRDSLPVGVLGIGEPMMYAVTLPLGKPFITACLGSGIGGMLAVLFHLGTVTQGVSGLFGLLIMVPGTQLQYVLAMLAAYVCGFVLTWFFGIDEERIDEVYGK